MCQKHSSSQVQGHYFRKNNQLKKHPYLESMKYLIRPGRETGGERIEGYVDRVVF